MPPRLQKKLFMNATQPIEEDKHGPVGVDPEAAGATGIPTPLQERRVGRSGRQRQQQQEKGASKRSFAEGALSKRSKTCNDNRAVGWEIQRTSRPRRISEDLIEEEVVASVQCAQVLPPARGPTRTSQRVVAAECRCHMSCRIFGVVVCFRSRCFVLFGGGGRWRWWYSSVGARWRTWHLLSRAVTTHTPAGRQARRRSSSQFSGSFLGRRQFHGDGHEVQ